MLLIGGIIFGSILYAGIKSRTKYKKVHNKKASIIKNKALLSQEKSQIKDQLAVISKREDNKDLSIATVSLGLVLAGNFLFPPLSIFGIAGLTYLVWPIWKRAYYDITQKKRFTRMVLESLILPSTLLAGQFLAAALAYWFLYLALHIVSKAKTNTTKNLNSIFEAPADQIVYVLRQDIEVEITLKEVQLGDILVIGSGETIPIDGTIIKGYASIDQHMLTGEAQPIEKKMNDSVFAATLILNGHIEIKVNKAGKETIAQQTTQILSEMTTFTDRLELRSIDDADRMALPYFMLGSATSVFKGASSGLAIFWAPLDDALYTAGPLSVLNYLNIALKRGILIKDGRTLEVLQQVDTFVFDKTGTLTHDIPQVVNIYECGNHNANDILSYAAAAEHKQIHPIALSILKAAKDKNIKLPQVKATAYQTGYGLTVEMDKKIIRVGSQRFMEQQALTVPKTLQSVQKQADDCGYSLVYVALNEAIIGVIELHASLRKNAAVTIQKLQTLGYKTVIISGDHEKPTQHLAQQLNIDTYFAETLPEDKAKHLKAMQKRGQRICYIGDGINDAIALKQAEVSISLQGASSIATDTAQIVLMNKELSQLVDLIELAENLNTTYRNTVISSALPTVGIVGGVFLFHTGLSIAIAAYMLGMGLSVTHAMLPVLKELYASQTKYKYDSKKLKPVFK